MKAQVIFKGTVKEAAVIKIALEHYIDSVQRGHVDRVESLPGKPFVMDGEPLTALRVSRQIVHDIEK